MGGKSIDSVRNEICGIDMEIITLISKRTELAESIGIMKKEKGIPLKNEEQEKKVKSRFSEEGRKLGLDPALMEKIAALLIEQALKSEEK